MTAAPSQLDKLARFRYRKRAQEYLVEQRKYCRIRADPKRK